MSTTYHNIDNSTDGPGNPDSVGYPECEHDNVVTEEITRVEFSPQADGPVEYRMDYMKCEDCGAYTDDFGDWQEPEPKRVKLERKPF